MGKVFSGESIRNSEIPEAGAHEKAADYILRRFFVPSADISGVINPPELRHTGFSMYSEAQDGISGAMIYGSTALGSASLRSDVDVFVVYHHDEAAKTLPFIQEVFTEAESLHHVPVESHALELWSLHDPFKHNIDPLFAEHLRAIQQQDDPQWSVNWPVDGLRTFPLTTERIEKIAVQYTSAKAKQFARSILSFRGDIDFNAFQRALELPGAIGRKVIPATAIEGETLPNTDNKYALTQLTDERLAVLQDHRFLRNGKIPLDEQKTLVAMDVEYNKLLAETIADPTKLGDYDEWLSGNYMNALESARSVAAVWTDLIVVSSRVRKQKETGDIPLFDDEFHNFEADDPYYDMY